MCWLSGERPESVVSFGHADSQLFKECNDFETVMVMLKFPSGLIGCIENVRGVPYGYDQRFEVRYCTVTWNSNTLEICSNCIIYEKGSYTMRSLKNIKRNYRRAKTDTKEYAWPAPFPQHGFLFLKTFIHRWEVFWSFFWPTFVFFSQFDVTASTQMSMKKCMHE